MKYSLLFCFICISFTSYSQKRSTKIPKDTLIWSAENPLVKENFEKKKSGGMAGMSSTGIIFRAKEVDGKILFVIEAVFVKSKSYMTVESDYVLKHEQLHFDLTELYARKLREQLTKKDFMKVKKMQEEINRLYIKVNDELGREQAKYDNETEHGMNMARQTSWNENIKTRLSDSQNFSETSVDIASK